jgi:hypothetical protein
LRDEITTGKLKPGESLSRRQIASRYGASFFPASQADGLGLVSLAQHVIAFVGFDRDLADPRHLIAFGLDQSRALQPNQGFDDLLGGAAAPAQETIEKKPKIVLLSADARTKIVAALRESAKFSEVTRLDEVQWLFFRLAHADAVPGCLEKLPPKRFPKVEFPLPKKMHAFARCTVSWPYGFSSIPARSHRYGRIVALTSFAGTDHSRMVKSAPATIFLPLPAPPPADKMLWPSGEKATVQTQLAWPRKR